MPVATITNHLQKRFKREAKKNVSLSDNLWANPSQAKPVIYSHKSGISDPILTISHALAHRSCVINQAKVLASLSVKDAADTIL